MKHAMKKAAGSIVAMIAGIVIYAIIPTQVAAFSDTGVTTRTIPYAMAVILIAAGFISAVLEFRAGMKEEAPSTQTPVISAGMIRVGIAVVAIILWLVLLKSIGFPVLTPILCAVLMLLSGNRRPIQILVLSVAMTAILYYVFKFLLYTPLPAGIFPW